MAALPYMQLYVADYLSDTMHLNAEEHGAYLLLIMNYWQTGKPLLNNDHRLMNIARVSSERWADVKRTLIEYFVIDGDNLVHPRIEADLEYVNDKQQKAINAGKASALARVKKAEAKKNIRTNGRSTVVGETLQPKPNHSDPDIDIDIEDSGAHRIANYLHKKILSENPSNKADPSKWIKDIEKAMRIDKRTEQDLIRIIDWMYTGDQFWSGVVLSGKKLRDKFDAMLMQEKRSGTQRNQAISTKPDSATTRGHKRDKERYQAAIEREAIEREQGDQDILTVQG